MTVEVVRFGDLATGTNQVTDPARQTVLKVRLAFLTYSVVCRSGDLVGIRQQPVRETFPVGECFLGVDSIK
ncbi:MAG: hypothetical protein ACI8Y4_004530 [Candidatus Poriferisodalaceae bacterium]|jgi:hypothetical protein